MGPFLCLALSFVRTLLQALFGQRTVNFILPTSVRRSQVLVHREVSLMEYRAHFRAGVEALFAVIMAHAATTHATEGQIVLRYMK